MLTYFFEIFSFIWRTASCEGEKSAVATSSGQIAQFIANTTLCEVVTILFQQIIMYEVVL